MRIPTGVSSPNLRCAPLRKEGEISHVPSFPNPDSCEFGYPLAVDPLSPTDSYCRLCCLELCPDDLAWRSAWSMRRVGAYAESSALRLGAQKYGWTEIWVAPHLWLGAPLCCQGSCLRPSFLWPSLGAALDCEGQYLWYFLFGDASCISGVVQYCQEYLLCVLAET